LLLSLLTIALFIAIALFAPLPLLVLPSLSSSSLPATLITIVTALFIAFAVACPPPLSPLPSPCRPHPLCPLLIPIAIALIATCHSNCCRYRLLCHLPTTFVAVGIGPATIAITIAIARHPCCHCNCSLHCLCLHLPTTLVTVVLPLGGGGEDHTNLAHNPTLATTASAAVIIAIFVARATSREGPVKQRACIQLPADGVH
jgi:hypothetical protein